MISNRLAFLTQTQSSEWVCSFLQAPATKPQALSQVLPEYHGPLILLYPSLWRFSISSSPHCSKWNGSCYFQSHMSPWLFIPTLASTMINLYLLKNILTCLRRHIRYGVPGVELWQTITTPHCHCLILKCQKHTCAGLLNSGHYFMGTAVLSQSTLYLYGPSGDRWSPASQATTCTHLSFHFSPPTILLLFLRCLLSESPYPQSHFNPIQWLPSK